MVDTAHLLEVYLDEYMNRWSFSGVVYVVKNGEVFLQKQSGAACYEFNIMNAIDTCFSLASVSKQFTAFAIMQLFDKNLLDIHSPANLYLPENLRIDPQITIHHLLSHTSGLYNFYNFDDDFFGIYNRNTYCRQAYFDLYIQKPLVFDPGSRYEYNNAGYNLLAWIVEFVSGRQFGDYLKDNIFAPLKMYATVLDAGTNIINKKAFPYDYERNAAVRSQYYNEKFSIGAGAIVSNCPDLYKWYECLKNRKLLSNKSYEVYFKANLNNYCYGLENRKIHEKNCYLHGGDHIGVMTYMLNCFEEDLCVIILSNAGLGNQYKMGSCICDILFSGKTEESAAFEEVALTDKEAQRYEGVYLESKIELRRTNENWEFVRFNGELHIPLHPVGNHQFLREDYDQFVPYTLKECADGSMEFLGYKKKR